MFAKEYNVKRVIHGRKVILVGNSNFTRNVRHIIYHEDANLDYGLTVRKLVR